MKPLWFAYCSCDDYPVVQREIDLREHDACVLRVDDVALLERVATSFENAAAATVVLVRDLGIEAHAALVESIAHTERAGRVIVFVEHVDPARIAPLFYAGAHEVVPLSGAHAGKEDAQSIPAATAKRESSAECAVLASQEPSSEPAAPARREPPSEPAASKPVSYDVDDLDEPEIEERSRAAVHTSPMRTGRRAPVICVMSGRGGVGKTTLATSMACQAARFGLRAALLDLDLMFGNAYEALGVEEPRDLSSLVEAAEHGAITEEAIVRSSMRIAPGLTLWGPIKTPERAELLGKPVELLLDVLKSESDVVIIDTSATWTDAVAAAVTACDRVLAVTGGGAGAATATQKLVSLVGRFGIPRTRVTCVVNRVGSRSLPEDAALRVEMQVKLSSKMRIADGGSALASLAAIGHIEEAVAQPTAFAQSVKTLTGQVLRELGSTVPEEAAGTQGDAEAVARPRLRLPWKNVGEAA